MKKSVTAIFDIGKTNKKFFLFDDDLQEVYREYTHFDLMKDEDGYPTEDLGALQAWIKKLFDKLLAEEKYHVKAVNFSTYGASFVHIDENGEVLTPLYNYTKPIDKNIENSFYEKYGPEKDFAIATGSFNAGLLNSGLQLYWLKYTKPEIFKKIKYALHLPQYISYLLTGIPKSEYTSIGCHTALWDYQKGDYHSWVYAEGIDKKLAPIVTTGTSFDYTYKGELIKIGVGIHDSSAALLPYLRSVANKFILVSTGTWSVALNPFSEKHLTEDDVNKKCINYMGINGNPVKAARLFLGNEYSLQVAFLARHFKVSNDYHKGVIFDKSIYLEVVKDFNYYFKWISIFDEKMPDKTRILYDSFEKAYHQLMVELVMIQVEKVKTAASGDHIDKLFVDGGFSDNDVYIKLLSFYLKNMELRTTNSSLGTALGAAIVLSNTELGSTFLEKNYALKKHVPFIINE